MTKVVAFQDFSSDKNNPSDGMACWLCQKSVSRRAFFCHHCGSVQPVREIDHFTRLGIEKDIDMDGDKLSQQYAALSRALAPTRFATRGLGERGHAEKQYLALQEAYDTLRDPVRRGRYWMLIHTIEGNADEKDTRLVDELQEELDTAQHPAHCDTVAQKAGQALQDGIMSFLQALRANDWNKAHERLIELDSLEGILVAVRTKRTALMALTRPQAH